MADQKIALVSSAIAMKWRGGEMTSAADALAVEEPLEIRLGGRRFTLTMRTPGHDDELAAGFMLAEGFIETRGDIDEISRVRDRKGQPEANAIDVILKVPSQILRERLRRNFTISSSCGVCGKTSIEALERRIAPLDDSARISAAALIELPGKMRAAQEVFAATGGLHAAALFEPHFRSSEGAGDGPLPHMSVADRPEYTLSVSREDVGRHNAVDKVIGRAVLDDRVPLHGSVMVVSGRISFEIVQKAAAAGIAILAAVSAPTSLAVELAGKVGVTLAGFVRESGFNVYSHAERIVKEY